MMPLLPHVCTLHVDKKECRDHSKVLRFYNEWKVVLYNSSAAIFPTIVIEIFKFINDKYERNFSSVNLFFAHRSK